MAPAPAIVICGPSGVGKGTLIKMLMDRNPDKFGFSVSHTTRKPREGEVNGVHYHFVTKEQIEEDIAKGLFVEHACVHGNYYGTSLAAVQSVAKSGKVCLLDIDVQGAEQVHSKRDQLDAKFLFLEAPSMQELERRLRGRATDSEEAIKKRLGNAAGEIQKAKGLGYFKFIVNKELEASYAEFGGFILGKASSAPPATSKPASSPAASTAASDGLYDFIIDFTLGGASGAISKTLTAPIERVKLLIQTQDANPRIMSGEVPRYTGIGNCFTRVAAEQGVASFWRGNGVNVIRYFPTQAFNLAFKDAIKKLFPKYSVKTDFWKFFLVNLASGGLAGAGSLTIVYPLDYARTRLASDVGTGKKQFNGLVDCLKKTASGPKGVMGIYNGFGVSVAGIIAYRGVQFGTFDTIIGINPYKNDKGVIGLVSTFGAAQTAVLASAAATYPLDTIRRRLQMQSELPVEKRIYTGTFQCAARIAKDEGVGALYKGFVANALRTVGAALVLVLYDSSKKYLGITGGGGGGE